MHRRVEVSLGNLEGAWSDGATLLDHVASVGLLDPASSLLIADAVAGVDQVAASDRVQRYVAESDLSTVLSNVFPIRRRWRRSSPNPAVSWCCGSPTLPSGRDRTPFLQRRRLLDPQHAVVAGSAHVPAAGPGGDAGDGGDGRHPPDGFRGL